MRLRAAHLASSAIVFVVAACSLTTIPDLTSGHGAAPLDAGGGAEAGRPDAGEAGSGPFCASLASAPAFCDDFDGDPDLRSRWTEVRAFDGAFGVELDTSAARSSPRSLVSRVGPGAPGCAYATAVKEMKGSFETVRLGFAVRIAQASDLPTPAVLGVVVIGGGSTQCQVYLSASATTLLVAEQIVHDAAPREERSHPVSPLLPIGEWRHVEIEYDLGAKRLVVMLDGQTASAMATTLACPYAPGNATGHVGLFCEPTGSSMRRVQYDDVTLDVR